MLFARAWIWFLLVLALPLHAACAQQEIPPPAGKGPVVVVVSGQKGAGYYLAPAQAIAAMGYDVVLLDANTLTGTHGQALHDAVVQAQTSPNGEPGKVAVVGFSLGGGLALAYASQWPDLVRGIVAWYPLTSIIADPAAFVTKVKVPVLMFAGAQDTYKNCCLIAQANALAAAAAAAGAPLTVVTYPSAGHDFIMSGSDYDATAAPDSFARAQAALAGYFGK